MIPMVSVSIAKKMSSAWMIMKMVLKFAFITYRNVFHTTICFQSPNCKSFYIGYKENIYLTEILELAAQGSNSGCHHPWTYLKDM